MDSSPFKNYTIPGEASAIRDKVTDGQCCVLWTAQRHVASPAALPATLGTSTWPVYWIFYITSHYAITGVLSLIFVRFFLQYFRLLYQGNVG